MQKRCTASVAVTVRADRERYHEKYTFSKDYLRGQNCGKLCGKGGKPERTEGENF